MRTRLGDLKLYVGDLRDCEAADSEWVVIHACDCQERWMSGKNRGVDGDLHLDLENSDRPNYTNGQFDAFLKFAKEQWATGKPMLIHSEDGNSRAPALALLFLAKVLYRISNADFDDAWVDFEKLVGQPFAPCEGLELFLRDHWRQLDLEPYVEATQQTARQTYSPDYEALMASLPEEPALRAKAAMELFRTQPLLHFSMTQILLTDHKWGQPKANVLQREMARVYAWCLEHGQKCRMIVLKPRKVGCSTFSAELCYHHMRRNQANMLILGDVSKRVEGVFQMFSAIHERDSIPWDSRYESNTLRGKFHYPDGGVGLVQHDTAMDPKVGIGETRTVVWMTEAARYSKTGVVTDKQVISALLNSIPDIALQLVIAESTAEGQVGWFWDTWQNASSLDAIANGAPPRWNGWFTVFFAWQDFPEHRMERNGRSEIWFTRELDERERRGIAIYGWDEEQIAWRRRKIAEDCGGDEHKFDEDFPESADVAFLTSGRPRFNMDGVTRLLKIAMVQHGTAELGYLVCNEESGTVTFREAAGGEAKFWVIERPIIGCSYIGFADPCTGAQSQGAKDPDSHAIGILRQGYHDKQKIWHEPRLVACIHVPGGCRYEDDIAAREAKMLLDWYGGCMIVPETGQGLGFIGELQRQGCNVYKRRKFNTMNPGQTIDVAGWETNGDTRDKIINALGEAIREHRFDCEYLPAVQEMRTFVRNDRKVEAARGAHDDWCMALGIGLYNLDLAQMLQPALQWRDAPVNHSSLAGGVSASAFS